MQANSINLRQIILILRKHWSAIVISLIAGILVSLGVTYLVMTPKYESSSLILVNQKQVGTDANMEFNQVQTDLQLINTYKDIITKPVILDQVKKNLNQDGIQTGSVEKLRSQIQLTNNQNSQVINVTATSNNPYTSKAIANEVSAVFSKKITKIMENAKNVSIISHASLDKTPVSPRPKLNLLIGIFLGLILGIIIAFVRELTDKRVRDTSFITDTLGMPLLGTITEINPKDMKFGSAWSSTSEGAEFSRSRISRLGGKRP